MVTTYGETHTLRSDVGGYRSLNCTSNMLPVRPGKAWAALLCVLFFGLVSSLLFPLAARAQVVNGDFSAGSTGWTSTVPSGSSLSYTGGQLTAVSDNNGGSNQRTFASQTITTGDPGFLSFDLVNWTTLDYGQFDYPTVRIGGTYFWITTAGALSTSGAAPSINNDNAPISVSGVRVLGNTTTLIGFGVTATDSCCGAGTAVWDNIEFQQLTQSPGAQVTPFNTPLTLSGANAPQVATNSGAGSMSVTMSVTNGTVTLATLAGITITSGANGSPSVTFTGSPANINNALNGIIYTPNALFSGAATLTFFANGGGTSDTDTIPITVQPPTYSFTISKTTPVSNVTATGQVITYTIIVNNTGTGQFVSPVASDLLDQNGSPLALTLSGPTGDGGVVGTMEAGETWTYTASHAVTQANMDDANDLVNTVTFNPAETAAQSASATTTITASPSLDIQKVATFGPGPTTANGTTDNVPTGTLITYTYTITNTGNQTISNISLSDVHGGYGIDPLPDPDTAVLTDNTPAGGSSNTVTGDGEWDALGPNDVLTIAVPYTVVQQDVDLLQ